MIDKNGFVFNYYNDGEITTATPTGQSVKFSISGNYMVTGMAKIKLQLEETENFSICLRVPEWSNGPVISLNGDSVAVESGYCMMEADWSDGDEIILYCNPEITKIDLNGKSAFVYGNLVLARDEQKEEGDIKAVFTPVMEDGKLVADACVPEAGETVRFLLKTQEGEVLLTDYASCGKKWMEERGTTTPPKTNSKDEEERRLIIG